MKTMVKREAFGNRKREREDVPSFDLKRVRWGL
jgi:hypothetical protein